MRPPSKTLTDQELEIMKIVWERHTATVRDVYEALLERRRVAYTTVMTMMKILEHKGYLNRKQVERAYVYRPAQPKSRVIRAMVRDFVNRVFNGSAETLLVHLIEDRHLRAAVSAAHWLGNLAAWSAQAVALIAAGSVAAWAFQLRVPRIRLAYWQTLLAICLLLPAVEPWRRAADSNIEFTMGAARPVSPNRPPAYFLPWRQA